MKVRTRKEQEKAIKKLAKLENEVGEIREALDEFSSDKSLRLPHLLGKIFENPRGPGIVKVTSIGDGSVSAITIASDGNEHFIQTGVEFENDELEHRFVKEYECGSPIVNCFPAIVTNLTLIDMSGTLMGLGATGPISRNGIDSSGILGEILKNYTGDSGIKSWNRKRFGNIIGFMNTKVLGEIFKISK